MRERQSGNKVNPPQRQGRSVPHQGTGGLVPTRGPLTSPLESYIASIESQELAHLVVPPLEYLIYAAKHIGSLGSVVNAWIFQTVLGWWKPKSH